MLTISDSSDEINKFTRQCLNSLDAYSAIHLCANSDKGDSLLYKSGVKTLALDNPFMSYIPWLVLNGELNRQSIKTNIMIKANNNY